VRSQLLEVLAEHEQAISEHVASTVNTKANDEAVRREAIAEAALQSVREALRLAVQGETDQLMRYEVRMAKEAAKKPSGVPELAG
jgi:rubrerythrin